jgi:hypothetical protein
MPCPSHPPTWEVGRVANISPPQKKKKLVMKCQGEESINAIGKLIGPESDPLKPLSNLSIGNWAETGERGPRELKIDGECQKPILEWQETK